MHVRKVFCALNINRIRLNIYSRIYKIINSCKMDCITVTVHGPTLMLQNIAAFGFLVLAYISMSTGLNGLRLNGWMKLSSQLFSVGDQPSQSLLG